MPSMGPATELPAFARSAVGMLWSATPSLTILTVAFMLDDVHRSSLERILRADHPTRLEAYGAGSIGIHSPELERRRLVAEAREDWRRQAGDWLARVAPGLLVGTPEGLSTCELTIVDGLVPYPSQDPDTHLEARDRRLLTALALDHSQVFEAADHAAGSAGQGGRKTDSGTTFAGSPCREAGLARHSIVALSGTAFRRHDAAGWGHDERRHAHHFESSFRDVASQWAVTHVLGNFEDRIAASRDALARIVGPGLVARALRRARRDTAECADAATVAKGVARGVADGFLVPFDMGLSSRRLFVDDEPERLRRRLKELLTAKAADLDQDMADLNATLHV